MPEEKKYPFHSFAFTLLENRQPRTSFRMMVQEGGLYELRVQKGSAANPSSQFVRTVPVEVADRVRDALQAAGVFGWEESYGDESAPGSRRWTLSIVFQEGVFSLDSKGGSDVPVGFDVLLEELYRLDFPRPAGSRQGGEVQGSANANGIAGGGGVRGVGSALNALGLGGLGSFGSMSAGDLGAFASSGQRGTHGAGGIDFSGMGDALRGSLSNLDSSELQDLLSQAQTNPQVFQQRMKEEFRHLTPDEQSRMLDALAATGMATREWWERFFRGL